MTRRALACLLPLLLTACVMPGHETPDPAKRKQLLESVKALEGTWEMKDAQGAVKVTEFKVSSGGSIVRETMFPGTSEEMTNVYRLEGNVLAMTHYCVMGNQPEMHAAALAGNELRFACLGVADRKAPDELYMGSLTLQFPDKDHLTENWVSFVKHVPQAEHSPSLAFTRRK
jgi:hypothetical protein